MNAKEFVAALADIRLPNVFNPYADQCGACDLDNAASVRKINLTSYLNTVRDIGVETIWMGRDLGYRGGRRTGLALTDESHLAEFAARYPGSTPKRATRGPLVAERTATEIWAAISALPHPPLLWNVFPFHPHEREDEMTNRRYAAYELQAVDGLNRELVSWLKIRRIVCIGQDAAKYAGSFGVEVECIRHPSYGGVSDFRSGIERLYGPVLQRAKLTQPTLF
ncbi:uracil-DNA glycosylase [Massilia cavernae]|uniref:Uracil-DNA glycosylase n=1 Tax=Massilia cavernae TaxID=2320864 RepID=A0A418XGX0_9BURK|nr:uracil-DNA glycosylase [Massilia cavernae]RJG11713.1 uracil-DNA glycosylase [Massilia cavernae]